MVRNGYTAIGSFSGGRVIIFVLEFSFVDRFLQFLPQALEGDAAWVEVETEITLRLTGRKYLPLIAQQADVTFEAFHYSGIQ